MPQPANPKHYSLHFSLGGAFVGVVVLTSLLLGLATYPNIRSFVREGIRERLGDAVGIAALQIDATRHARLATRADETSPEYQALQEQLRQIRDRGTGMRFVYTLRKGADGRYLFGVDGEEKEDDRSHIGDVYEDPTPFMVAAFTPPYRVQIEDRFYRDKWGVWLSSYAPIIRPDGSLEAVLAIDISAAKVLEYERRYLFILSGVGLGICILVALISLLVSRRVCRPLLLLEQDMARMQRFDLGENIHIPSRIVEIVSMERAVNNMKNGLRSFKKYVPAELVGELITLRKEAVLEADKRQLTVFFCDIQNFTGLSENLPPEELARRMGVYFGGMTEIILRHQGTVDKYIGDSIMAFWGAPRPCDAQAARACLAALECRNFVVELAAEWQSKGIASFATRFGINTGEAIVGNFGYEERLNYTAMGDSVNVASRLEGLNKEYGTTILISESTFLQAKHVIEARILDRIVMKGKSIGITVYELLGEKGSLSVTDKQSLDRYNQGMELFFSGELTAAGDIFAELSRTQPHDRAAAAMLVRCRKA